YHVLGWSFGGVLALELAVQLTRAGDEIANLILIDSLFNVTQAAAALGLRELERVIDPINVRYTPTAADLARVRAQTGTILLFKATELDATFTGEHQREFFAYYAQSPYNNLDTLIPAESLAVESLGAETHFSWVTNPALVAAMSARIRDLVGGAARNT
ncbi:MAG TPA: thioesterase domain-containing protein, partial [Herpetosiphonaceae bacterium]